MWEPRTAETGFSFSPELMGTPTARDYKGVPGKNVQMASLPRDVSLLPAPRCQSNGAGGYPEEGWTGTRPNGGKQAFNLATAVALLPTPNTLDDMPAKTRAQIKAHRDEGRGGDRNLREYVLHELPPPLAGDRWGRYAPAIARWETVLGRSAPEPVEPTGKDGAYRLSPAFTEFLMGVEPGWVTGTGISRKAQLHVLGNGVVPQQAAMALRILLERMESA